MKNKKSCFALAALSIVALFFVGILSDYLAQSSAVDAVDTETTQVEIIITEDVEASISQEPTETNTPTTTPSPTATWTRRPTQTNTATSTPEPETSIDPAKVAGRVNIRSGPGTTYSVITTIEASIPFKVIGRNEDGSWILIKIDDNTRGWIGSQFVYDDFDIPSIIVAMEILVTPTRTPQPSATKAPTNTQRPSPTPIATKTQVPALTVNEIYLSFQIMTTFQFSEYKKEIAGKLVRDSLRVGNVSKDGKVLFSGPWLSSYVNWHDFCVVLTGFPKQDALELRGGKLLSFEAVVNGIVGNNNYYYNCDNTLVLVYRSHTK